MRHMLLRRSTRILLAVTGDDSLQDHRLFTFPYGSVTPCNIIGGHCRVTNNVIQFADTQTFHLVEWSLNEVRVGYWNFNVVYTIVYNSGINLLF